MLSFCARPLPNHQFSGSFYKPSGTWAFRLFSSDLAGEKRTLGNCLSIHKARPLFDKRADYHKGNHSRKIFKILSWFSNIWKYLSHIYFTYLNFCLLLCERKGSWDSGLPFIRFSIHKSYAWVGSGKKSNKWIFKKSSYGNRQQVEIENSNQCQGQW